MQVKISTPTKTVTLEDITYIRLPAASGETGILENHAPMVITLTKGEIAFKPKGNLEITGGMAFVQHNTVLITTDAELPHDL